jgi:von Willebrand factor type A domain-containing protein
MSLQVSMPNPLWGLLLAAACACSSESSEPPGEVGPGATGPVFDQEPGSELGERDPDGSGFNGGTACVGQTAGTESAPAVLQLVVDTSGSMDQDAPGGRDSKWIVTRRALLGAIAEMPADTSVGVVFYPDVPIESASCFDAQADVEIAALGRAGSAERREIEGAFREQAPNGGTPTHDAYRYASERLEASAAVGSRFAVVITDGTPTFSLGCEGTGLIRDPVDAAPLVVEAQAARARGISTFVIGSPGSEGARENLSRMAEAGGTARPGCSHAGPSYCHFDMTTEQDFASALVQALGTISGLALSCSYPIPTPPGGATLDPELVNVLFSPDGGERELIARSAGGACNEGWQYSEDGSQVLLCGSTCDRVRESNGSLELEFGCVTRVR